MHPNLLTSNSNCAKIVTSSRTKFCKLPLDIIIIKMQHSTKNSVTAIVFSV